MNKLRHVNKRIIGNAWCWLRRQRFGTDPEPEPLPSLEDVPCIGPIDLEGRVRLRSGWQPGPIANCRNCHFLAKRRQPDPSIKLALEPWTGPERRALEIDQRDGLGPVDYLVKCERGYWGPEYAMPELDTLEPLHAELRRDRGDSCSFVSYRQGMTFEAARVQGERERQDRQSRENRRHRWITLGLSGFIAIAVSLSTDAIRHFAG